jgi:P-type Ca2+ transporter type 2C
MTQKFFDKNNLNWHSFSWEDVIKKLNSDIEKGLSEKEVKTRQKEIGKNKLPEEKPLSCLSIFLEQFKSPLIYILVIAGIITLFLKDYTDSVIILSAVFLNAIIGFWQENKTAKTLQELKKAITHSAEVLRSGNLKIIDSQELVPGDILILNAGSNVPADARIIESHELKINESALTGEWLSVNKKTDVLKENTSLADRNNMVYMGTVIEGGKGKAIITATGLKTEIGKIAEILRDIKEEKTPYQKKLARFAKTVGAVVLFICLLIFILGMLRGQEFVLMFVTVVAIAVAAIPEGLPVAVTLVFTFGMREILKKKGLVRKLIAAEILGSTSVIATDKTGTLTEAKMEMAEIHTVSKIFGQEKSEDKVRFLALKIAGLCSEAFIENLDQPMEKWLVRGRPTDRALLMAAVQAGLNPKELKIKEPKIDEIPFDSIYKYSAVLHKLEGQEEKIIYFMGAPEVVLEKSKLLEINGNQEEINLNKIEKIQEKYNNLTSQGFRVVSVAYKKVKNSFLDKKNKISDKDLQEMIFVGFIVLHDPIRKKAREAIQTCRQAGMKPIIVTGDHKLTAKAIAEKVGFTISDKNILEGKDLEKLSGDDFRKVFKDIEVYARVTPEQKLRIIEAWQEIGEVVAMTGDGVNDAPALKKANIGVALGSGTEVAKEVSDLTLLTDNFEIIIIAVEEGRRIIDNIRKIITYLLTGGFTEVTIIGLSVLFHLPLPVLPGQILWKNLIESTPPSLALALEKKEKGIMERRPEPLNLPLLNKQMKFLIFVIGFFTNFLLFAIFIWLLNNPNYGIDKIGQIRTIIFSALAIDSFFFIFSFRNLKRNIWQYNPFSNFYLNIAAIGGFLFLSAAIYLPIFQIFLKTVPLGFFEWFILIIFGLINLFLIEMAKWLYIKKIK